jgi:hypothetical protein
MGETAARGAQQASNLENIAMLREVASGHTIDGKAIVLVCKIGDGTTVKFGIPLVEIPSVFAYMMDAAARASEICSEEDLLASAKPREVRPSRITSITLGVGQTHDSDMLVVRFGHIELAFPIPTAVLIALATKILRLAEADN